MTGNFNAEFKNATQGKRAGSNGRGFVTRNMMNRVVGLGTAVGEDVSKKAKRVRDEWKREGHILVRKNIIEKV